MGKDPDYDLCCCGHSCLYCLLPKCWEGRGNLVNKTLKCGLFKVMANLFKWVYRKLYYCLMRRSQVMSYEVMDDNELEDVQSTGKQREQEEILIPSSACVWVMLLYISLGTIMFAEWEQWDYLDSAYFCVTSLLKATIMFIVHQYSFGSFMQFCFFYFNFIYRLAWEILCRELMQRKILKSTK